MFKYVLSHKENFQALSNPIKYRKFQVAPAKLRLLWRGIYKDNFIVKTHEAQTTAAHDAAQILSYISGSSVYLSHVFVLPHSCDLQIGDIKFAIMIGFQPG